MSFKQIRMALYALYLTNRYGFKFKKARTTEEIRKLRHAYSETLLSRLNIEVTVSGLENIKPDGQYLIISNHRSIIDPCVIEMALKSTHILGLWVSKKELYNSLFFGKFVRNSGTILLDRESKQMGPFFKAIKEGLQNSASICVFPEGTRNTQNTKLSSFKDGSQLIAVKNRLPILPVYIKNNAQDILRRAITKREKNLNIEIIIGNIMDYKDRTMSLEQAYRQMFDLVEASV